MISDAELEATAVAAIDSESVTIDGGVLYLIARELLSTRKALAECGEKLAHRDQKIAELRELIHAGAPSAGATNAKQSAKRPPRR